MSGFSEPARIARPIGVVVREQGQPDDGGRDERQRHEVLVPQQQVAHLDRAIQRRGKRRVQPCLGHDELDEHEQLRHPDRGDQDDDPRRAEQSSHDAESTSAPVAAPTVSARTNVDSVVPTVVDDEPGEEQRGERADLTVGEV